MKKSLKEKKLDPKKKYCYERFYSRSEILLEITEENFAIIDKLQKASCTKLEIGDFVTESDSEIQIFTKELKLKSRSWGNKKVFYQFNEDETEILGKYKQSEMLEYMEINTKELLKIARYYRKNAKIGSILVMDPECGGIVDKKYFNENFIEYKHTF